MTEARSPRLLIVVVEFPPLGGGGVLRVTKLVKYLARLGWDITVVCSDEPVAFAADSSLLRDIPDSVRVHRIRGPFRFLGGPAGSLVQRGARRGLPSTPLRWAKAFVRSFLVPDRWIGWAWRVGRLNLDAAPPDVVLSSGPPHSAHIAGGRLARRFGVPHIIDLRDDWAANPLHSSPLPWHDPLDAALERSTVGGAAAIVVVSDAARDAYAAQHPRLAPRIQVITNGFDPEDLPPAGTGRPADRPIVFLHAGSLRNNSRQAGPMLAAFGPHAARSGAILELLGPISPEHEREARSRIPAGNLRIEALVEHAEAIRRMADADVLVVVTSEAEAGTATMTGKIFEYLAVGKPILLIAPAGPAADLIRETGAGVVAQPDDTNDIDRALTHVLALVADPDFSAASADFLRQFDRGTLAGTWSDLLADAVRKHRRLAGGRE